MITIDCRELGYQELNGKLHKNHREYRLTGCCGQRFIAAGMSGKHITIEGIPGNALGAYLNGASITVQANAQDAVGDTMNEGKIVVYGSIGDAAGYAMRGGQIFVRDNAGYRAGIHMKAYGDKTPALIIGGFAGSFLGEYQAGGTILVLGRNLSEQGKTHPIVGNFPGTGMHGGKMFLRGDCSRIRFPGQVTVRKSSPQELAEIRPLALEYGRLFGCDTEELLQAEFTTVLPDSKNPYRQMYVAN